jgi:hypothetical protein
MCRGNSAQFVHGDAIVCRRANLDLYGGTVRGEITSSPTYYGRVENGEFKLWQLLIFHAHF